MSEKKSTQYVGGIGFTSLLFLLFLSLKLTGVIDWSWWWVTAPLWGGLALTLGFLVSFALFALVVAGGAAVVAAIFFKRSK